MSINVFVFLMCHPFSAAHALYSQSNLPAAVFSNAGLLIRTKSHAARSLALVPALLAGVNVLSHILNHGMPEAFFPSSLPFLVGNGYSVQEFCSVQVRCALYDFLAAAAE